MLLVRVAFKHATMPTTVTCGTAGWTKIGQYNNGTTVSGNGTGSVIVAVFYKEATSGAETNPVITYHASVAATPSAAVAMAYSKGASEAWVTPVGDGGPVGTGTAISSTIQSHISVTAGDMVDFFYSQGDNNTLTVPTITQAGVTFGTVSEQPAAALSSATSNDIDADGGYRLASSGTSSAAAVITGTASAGDQGSSWQTRLRVVAVTTVSGSFTADANISKTGISGTLTANAYIKNTMYGTGSGSTVLIHDNFTTGTNLNNRTPDTVNNGQTWVNGGIAFQVGSGLVTLLSGNTEVGYIQASTANVDVELTGISVSNVSSFGVVFRYQDIDNFWHFDAYQGSTVDEDNWYLYKRISGVDQQVASGPGGQTPSAVRAVASGNDISLYIDGGTTPEWTGTDSQFATSTVVGIYGDTSSAIGPINASAFKATSVGGLNTTFTADAWVKGTPTGSFTADAWIAQSATTYNGSFTADAWVQGTVAGAFTADSIIRKVDIPGSFTANAWVSRTFAGTLTADAWVSKVVAGAITSDAIIRRTDIAGSVTANAIIRKTDIAGSLTANAHILRTFTGSFTADAAIVRTWPGSFTADAWITKTTAGSFTANAWVSRVFSGSLTADAYVRRADITQSITADAFVKRADIAGSFTANAMVQRTFSGSFTADAWIEGASAITYPGSFTADAWVKGTPVGAFTADALIAASPSGTFTADAYIRKTTSGSFTANAWLSIVSSGSLTANAFIRKTDIAGSLTANAHIRRTDLSGSLTANAWVKRTFEGSITANAHIAGTVAGSFTVDAWIASLGTVAGSFTADAIIRRTDLSGSFTANAYISRQYLSSFSVDAHIKRTFAGTLTAEAWVKGTVGGSITADAYVKRTAAQFFTADAYVQSTISGSVTADAWLAGTVLGAFTVNAVIYNPNAVKAVLSEVAILRTYGVRLSVDITLDSAASAAQSYDAAFSIEPSLNGEASITRSLVGRTEKL